MRNLESKKTFNKYFVYVISFILSVVSAISISVYIYAKSGTTYNINIKENKIIYSIYINDNRQDLNKYKNEHLVIKKNGEIDTLKAINDTTLTIKTSVIDSVSISFNNGKGITVARDKNEKILKNNENYYYNVGKSYIIGQSLNIYTLLFFIISYIFIYLCIVQINKFLIKMNNNSIKSKDILIFFIANFIIFLSNIYLLLSIFKSFILIFIIAYLIYLIYRIKDVLKDNLVYTYIILSTIIGISFLFLIPPLNVPDEPAHFVKSYTLLDKKSINDNGYAKINKDLYNFITDYKYTCMDYKVKYNGRNYLNALFKTDDSESNSYTYNYTNTKKASILPYLPSALMIMLGKSFLPSLFLLIFSRAINLVLSIIICYHALKIAPYFKKIFFVIMLLPTFIQQSAGINMDWLTNSVSLLIISYIMKLIYINEKINFKDILYLLILGFILSFCKFGFFPIMFLILLIPNKKIENTRLKPILIKILLILFVIIISYLNNTGMGGSTSLNSPYYTIKFAISHPLNTISVYLKTFINRFDTDIFKGQFDSFGVYTKWKNSLFVTLLIIMYSFIFLVRDDNNKKLTKKERIVYLAVSAILILIPYTAMFLCWTFLGESTINGLQPRYFLVAELLLFIGISSNLFDIRVKNKNKLYIGCILFDFCISLATILIGFY